MYEKFDFSVLTDPAFKEDAVREELIQPLIRELGYGVSGDARVIRSKALKHPFVSIGSARAKISLIPDYVFEVDGKVHWILDAKSPREQISKSSHVEQAYSYAIHPEIRAPYYALCNGKQFALYDVRKCELVVSFDMQNIDVYLEQIVRLLHPKYLGNPELVNYQPDFGLALHQIGIAPGFIFVGRSLRTNFFAKLRDGAYTTTATIPDNSVDYMASFDFDEDRYHQLLRVLGDVHGALVNSALSQQPFSIDSKKEIFQFGVKAVLQPNVCHNSEESYIPLLVSEFFPSR